jgi:hypothetical protein
MGQVYTCPSCAKKIEDGQDWSLVWEQGDVEIRAHAEDCAMKAMPRFHRGTEEARFGYREAEEKAISTGLATRTSLNQLRSTQNRLSRR